MSPESFREDAPPALALERERHLQRCRERLNERRIFKDDNYRTQPDYRPWSAEDLAALEWTDALAAAGHFGAGRVVERVIEDKRLLEQLYEIAPAKLQALAARWPEAASLLARKLAAREPPDWELVQRCLAAGETLRYDRQRAAEMRELSSAAGAPAPHDIAALRADFDLRSRDTGALLVACAKWRLASGDRRTARALAERAAALGSKVAAEALFDADFTAAPDKPEFMRQWIDAGKPLTPKALAACLGIGKGFESGTPQMPVDFDEALRWYERALGKKARKGSGLSATFCGFLAMSFDRRLGACLVNAEEFAMRWYQRSLELGDEDSMAIWLQTCAEGEMGLAPDPASALERAQRFRASGVDVKAKRWRLADALRAVHAAAAGSKDAKLAAQWREVAALLERD